MRMKKVMITQSNYIPWKGYFDSIALVDVFVLYDEVQYTKRDWRNRNLIKTPQGPMWLTIPVEVKGKYYQNIKDVRIADRKWARDHLKAIQYNYARAAAYKEVFPFLEDLYRRSEGMEYLSEVNYLFLQGIMEFLGIRTPLRYSWEYPHESQDKNLRLIEICRAAGGTDYYTGPAARSYLSESTFEEHGVRVHWLDYGGYPEYPQLYPPFEHGVSIIDLLLNTGAQAPKYMKYVR